MLINVKLVIRIFAVALFLAAIIVSNGCARDMEKERQNNLGDEGPSTNQIYIQFNTQNDVSKDLYYYIIFKTSDVSSTDATKFPATVLTGSNRGNNWDTYLVFHADEKLGVRGLIEEWSYLSRSSTDTTNTWLDADPQKAALASFVTGINIGRKLVGVTVNTKNLRSPDGKVPKQYAVMFMTATTGFSLASSPDKGIVLDRSSRPIIVENTVSGGWVSDNSKYNVLPENTYPANPGELDLVVSDGKPAISYFDLTNLDLKFAYSTVDSPTQKTDWAGYILDDTGSTGLYQSTALLDGGGFCVAYYDSGNKALKFALTNSKTPDKADLWTKYTISNAGAAGEDVGISPSVIINNGKPMIFYYNATTKALMAALASNGTPTQSDWTVQTVHQVSGQDIGMYPSAMMVNNVPAVVFNNDTENKLLIASGLKAEPASSGDWKVSGLSGVAGNGSRACLSLLGSSSIVSYYDPVNKDLAFAFTNTLTMLPDALWVPSTVDTVGDVGSVSALTVYNDQPAISYYDATNLSLKFAYAVSATPKATSDWGISVIDSKDQAGNQSDLVLINGKPVGVYYNQTVNEFTYTTANTAPPTKPEDWSSLALNLKSSGDASNPAGDIIDWRGRCYERAPTRMQMEFTFRDPIEEQYYYYFVFNFGNSPLTSNGFRPYNYVYGDDRGKNWDCYIRFKGKSGDALDKWQYAIRKPEDLDTVSPRWTEDLTYIKQLSYQPFALASETSVNGSKIILTLDLQKFTTPQGSLPENFMFDIMTSKHPIENVDTQWTADDARVFDYLSLPIVVYYDPTIDFKEETFKYEDPDINSYNPPGPADITDWRVRVW